VRDRATAMGFMKSRHSQACSHPVSGRVLLILAMAIVGVAAMGGPAAAKPGHQARSRASAPRKVSVAQLYANKPVRLATADPAQEASPMPTLEGYWKTLDQIRGSFFNPDLKTTPDPTDLTYAAIRGVLSSLDDPYTRFLAPAQYAEMQRENRGSFPGIGVELSTVGTTLSIVKVLPNSPASAAGIMKNDELLQVNGASMTGKTAEEVGELLKGEEGTTVALMIRRGAKELPFNLTRKEIDYPHFESRVIGGDIGYMHLLMFDEQAADNISRAMDGFSKQGVRGLILDLRDNPGGLVTAAVDVASKFIPPGTVVYVQERAGRRNGLPTDQDTAVTHHLPLVVLVNHFSASASEIVTGAIQDTHSGTIVGIRTWGKGLVQEIMPLNDNSAIALTTAHYYTPSGADINLKGIMPDVVVGHIVQEPDDQSDAAQAAYNRERDQVDAQQLQEAITILKQKMTASGPRVALRK